MPIVASAFQTITDLYDPIQQGTSPSNPVDGMLWMDTSDIPNVLRRWTDGQWVECGPDVNSQIGTALSNLLTDVEAAFVNKDDMTLLVEQVNSQAEQTGQDIEYVFERSRLYAVELTEGMKGYIDTIQAYQRFSVDGLELGVLGSPFIAKLGNTRLSFLQDGTEVAYISNNKLYITHAEISGSLTVGNPDNGYLEVLSTPSGVGFVWREE